MASTHKSLRSSTANKRPTTAIADGQIALNTNATSPGLFFKDSAGGTIIKVGPVHVGTTAPNATPAAGGSSGNSTGEVWLDTSLTPPGVKIWNGGAWTNATPAGSTTVQGLLELATNAETQAGSDAVRAVTPASLQSKVSDSTSTTSSTTIASSTAVKSAYDLANAALPKTGGTVTGTVTFGTTGVLAFEGSTDDGFETAIAVVDPTADNTITLPNVSGTVITTGDTGTVTSTMIADGTIVNADVNASAAIAGTKISPNFGSQTVQTTGVFSHALGTAGAPTITFTGDTNTGIYSPGADQVAISTNGSGRLFIDSPGRLLVGASSALSVSNITAGVEVHSTTTNSGASISIARFNNDTSGPPFILGKSRNTTVAAGTIVQDGDELGSIYFAGDDGTDLNTPAARIQAFVDGTPGANDMPGRIVLSTTADGASSPTERMRIGSDGTFCFNTGGVLNPVNSSTAASLGLNITSDGGLRAKTTQTVNSVFFEQNITGYTSGVANYQRFRVDGNIIGSITSTNGTSTSYNTSSDYRLKENVTAVTDGITRLQQLKPSRFNFIADPDKTVDGFLAHEVQDIVPEAITGEKDAVDEDGNAQYQGIDQSKLVPLLTAALQEAIGRIETLEAEVATLKAQ